MNHLYNFIYKNEGSSYCEIIHDTDDYMPKQVCKLLLGSPIITSGLKTHMALNFPQFKDTFDLNLVWKYSQIIQTSQEDLAIPGSVLFVGSTQYNMKDADSDEIDGNRRTEYI